MPTIFGLEIVSKCDRCLSRSSILNVITKGSVILYIYIVFKNLKKSHTIRVEWIVNDKVYFLCMKRRIPEQISPYKQEHQHGSDRKMSPGTDRNHSWWHCESLLRRCHLRILGLDRIDTAGCAVQKSARNFTERRHSHWNQ